MKEKRTAGSSGLAAIPLFSELIFTLIAGLVLLFFLISLPRINSLIMLNTKANKAYIIKHYLKTDPKKAVSFAAKIADKNPKNPFDQLEAGLLNLKYKNETKAKVYLKKASDLFYFPYARHPWLLSDPHLEKMGEAYLNYGRLILTKTTLEESLFYLLYATDIYRDHSQKVLKTLEEFEKKNPLSEAEILELADFYLNAKDFRKSAHMVSRVKNPIKDWNAIQAKLHALTGNTQKANELFMEELKLFPDNLPALLHKEINGTTLKEDIIKERNFIPLLKKDHIMEFEHVEVSDTIIPLYRGDARITYKATFDHARDADFFVVGRSRDSQGIWPVLEITINGEKKSLVYVHDYSWRAFPVRLSFRKGTNTITLRFLNDGCSGRKFDNISNKWIFTENRDLYLNNIWYK